jgi:ribonuclease-3
MLKQQSDENGSPVFCFQVMLEGVEGERGIGYSKKESQQQASEATLKRLKREPQFVDTIFASKTNRTKMEEEPAMAVPDTDQEQNFLRPNNNNKVPEETVSEESFDDSEFDLSDISHKEKSREDIIAEAEAAAFADSPSGWDN